MRVLKYYIKRAFPLLRPKDPYTSSNDRLKCIFIHIPKCGGISIDEALFGEKVGHKNYIDFKIYDTVRCLEYTKFTVVRDPIDRFISAFYFLKSGGRNVTDFAWAQEYLSRCEEPEELIEAMRADSSLLDSIFKWQHFRPQYTFLLGELDQIEMDYILRFNHLEDDFDELVRALGISARLPHANKTKSKAVKQMALKHKSIEFLKKQYREDYLRFTGYFS